MYNLTQTVLFSGNVNPSLLISAVEFLQEIQPMLQVGIQRSRFKYFFYQLHKPRDYIRLHVVAREGPDHWKKVHECVANNASPCLKDKEPWLPWEIHFLHDIHGLDHEVILSCSHAIFDGQSLLLFARQFIESLQAIQDGMARMKVRSFPSTQEADILAMFPNYKPSWKATLMPDFMRGIWDNVLFQKKFDPLPIEKNAILEDRIDRVQYDKIDRNQMERIRSYCKMNNITVNSFFLSIFVLSTKTVWNLQYGFEMKIGVPVGLRQFMSNRWDHDQIRPMNTSVTFNYVLNDGKFAKQALKMQKEIKDNLVQKAISGLEIFGPATSIARYLSTKMINNEKSGRNGQFTLSNFGISKKARSTDFTLNGICTSSCTAASGGGFTIYIATYDDECFVSFTYCFPCVSDDHASEFMKIYRKTMEFTLKGI